VTVTATETGRYTLCGSHTTGRFQCLAKLSDNQVGDRLHAALEAIGTDEGETIRGNTALVAASQTLSLLEQGLLIAAERNSDDVSVMMNQPIVPPSE
jgi:hypothetical protein